MYQIDKKMSNQWIGSKATLEALNLQEKKYQRPKLKNKIKKTLYC